ncbi:VOC family protein [Pelosinus fermentans]|jgi:predicted enzyme related to lactoylglutathione lyase|uniref:Glyoxalase-like domain containing protein n=1 Tax=Pelosinus fermentans JBW45 TaxID=1192197 RepID=I8TV43_9FIRM|nr:VOC family protein [Pelosinus fermentans]AJQ25771.1 Glyoxalase-like domain containing protein [Pelosinus fermentans JBW45]
MQIKRVDSTINTNKLQESKEFYMKHFDFQLVYESDWYIELIARDLPTNGISFTLPQREEGEFFNGKGLIISFQVDDVDAEYKRLKEEGVIIYQEMQDKHWGERSFVVNDPNGIHLYIYTPISPTPEYQKIYDSFKND